MKRLVVVSGLSGAGKSVVLKALEDSGFYCVDNLPIGVLKSLSHFVSAQESTHYDMMAVGIDIRNTEEQVATLPHFLDSIETIDKEKFESELIFISASVDVLLKRYSETRRKHPLSTEDISLRSAIDLERKILDQISARADLRVDTSLYTVHELRRLVQTVIVKRNSELLSIQFQSFGYKRGVPRDADFVFDVRCLPNPYWRLELRDMTGSDEGVKLYLDSQKTALELVDDVCKFLDRWLSSFEKMNRMYLTIAFGCTGGRHRSVYVAEKVAAKFDKAGKNIKVFHRDV